MSRLHVFLFLALLAPPVFAQSDVPLMSKIPSGLTVGQLESELRAFISKLQLPEGTLELLHVVSQGSEISEGKVDFPASLGVLLESKKPLEHFVALKPSLTTSTKENRETGLNDQIQAQAALLAGVDRQHVFVFCAFPDVKADLFSLHRDFVLDLIGLPMETNAGTFRVVSSDSQTFVLLSNPTLYSWTVCPSGATIQYVESELRDWLFDHPDEENPVALVRVMGAYRTRNEPAILVVLKANDLQSLLPQEPVDATNLRRHGYSEDLLFEQLRSKASLLSHVSRADVQIGFLWSKEIADPKRTSREQIPYIDTEQGTFIVEPDVEHLGLAGEDDNVLVVISEPYASANDLEFSLFPLYCMNPTIRVFEGFNLPSQFTLRPFIERKFPAKKHHVKFLDESENFVEFIADGFHGEVLAGRGLEERLHMTITIISSGDTTKTILHCHGRCAPRGSILMTDFEDMETYFKEQLIQYQKAFHTELEIALKELGEPVPQEGE